MTIFRDNVYGLLHDIFHNKFAIYLMCLFQNNCDLYQATIYNKYRDIFCSDKGFSV